MVATYDLDEPFIRVGPEEAERLVALGAALVDVREPGEFSQGHIPGSRLAPLGRLLADPRSALAPELARVDTAEDAGAIFVCAVGVRSAVAAEMAATVGLRKVYNLDGGLSAWARSGLPVES